MFMAIATKISSFQFAGSCSSLSRCFANGPKRTYGKSIN